MPYPATSAQLLKVLADAKDIDIDNARRLAMLDVFDVYAFGRPSIETEPIPLAEAKKRLMEQFAQEGDEELIGFLIDQYETVKKLTYA